MKVVHITLSSFGGAGIAAKRLHLGLLSAGVDSNMVIQKSSGENFTGKIEFKNSSVLELFKRIGNLFLKPFGFSLFSSMRNYQLVKNIDADYEFISFPASDYKVENCKAIQEADIIHLHWISDFVNYPTFFKKLKNKKFVWTLHDTNPFMGIFHYPGDFERNKNKLKEVDQMMLEVKNNALKSVHTLEVVCLSEWMMLLSRSSNLFKNYHHSLIRNGIDTNIFKFENKSDAKRNLNIPVSKTVLLFVSDDIHNIRKGYTFIHQLLKDEFSISKNIQFVAVGKSDQNLPDEILFLGKITNESDMAQIYQAADAFLLPSLEDNLPNTMLESLCCGTPVISFKTGGMVDVIQHGINGLFCDEMSSSSLKKAIEYFLNNLKIFDGAEISRTACSQFNSELQVQKIKAVYSSLMS